MSKSGALLLILFLAHLYACNTDDVSRTLLNDAERPIYDSIISAELNLLRKESDSICAKNRDSLIQRAIDSIYRLRVEEIKLMLHEDNVE